MKWVSDRAICPATRMANLVPVIMPSEKTLPARLNMDIISRLQQVTAPEVFTSRAVYDGRKNLFAGRELPFGGASSREVGSSALTFHSLITCCRQFDVTLSNSTASDSGKGPKVYKTRLTKVAEINPEWAFYNSLK